MKSTHALDTNDGIFRIAWAHSERSGKTKVRKTLALFFVILGITAFAGSLALPTESTEAAPVTLEIPLVGGQEVPPVTGPGSAFARLTFDETTKGLTFAVTVSGIAGEEVTAAHIHRGPAGVNGPIVHTLSDKGFTTVDGSITLTDADIADLKAGNLYVNVHSKTNPGGFARGQIYLTPDQAIRAFVLSAVDAWNKKDVQRFISNFTASGLAGEFGFGSLEEAAAALSEFIGQPQISLSSLNVQALSSTEVKVVADLISGLQLERHDWVVSLVGGAWRVSQGGVVNVPVPGGTPAVPVQLREFAFVYDKNAVANGNFAFQATNVGAQFHEIALAKLPAVGSLQELLATEGEVPGFEFVGVVRVPPGATGNMVFTKPLTNGRYAMVCFIPDEATGTPHAFLGMVSEFNVTSGAGTVRPPGTGDAGLLGSQQDDRYGLLAAGALSILLAGIIALSGRRAHQSA